MQTKPRSGSLNAPDQRAAALGAFAAVSLLYCIAYVLANQLTHARIDVGTAVFAWERSIPFMAWTIVPYLSIVPFFAASFLVCRDRAELHAHVRRVLAVLALSLACFALWPLRFTFERPSVEGALGALFELLHLADLPYNRAPSLHVSVVVILWAVYGARLRGAWRSVAGLWFGLIGLSVLTTYQHHVIDVPAGLIAGWFCVWLFPLARTKPTPAIFSWSRAARPG
jgi:membrane-associated phospholipid phosphatase